MNYLSVEDLTKMYGDKVLFEKITFGLNKGDKVGLIARNGSGKTTLLKVLAGIEEPDSGKVVFRKDIKVGLLMQDVDFEPGLTILDAVFSSDSEVFRVVKNYELAVLAEDHEKITELYESMERMDAWNLENKVKEILGKLGLDRLDAKVGTLSGGQQKRIALAKLLIENPDLIILDEPTNHLDIEMISWLESYLSTSNTTLFMVTHDRYFLDAVTNKILEIDRGDMYMYKGSYGYFLEKREERQANMVAQKQKAQGLLKKELEWFRRQPKARTTKSKARIDAIGAIKQAASVKTKEEKAKISSQMERLGSKILEFHNVSKSYGDKVLFKGFDYKFGRNDFVGLVGKNGSGKSTLINMMLGNLPPDTGKIIVGETVKFSLYSQDGLQGGMDQRVIEVVKKIAEVFPLKGGKFISAAQMLERFLFPRDMHYLRVDQLSGGERKRLHLVQVLMKNPNFLILDEPTNDLDILTINVLEDFLLSYPGCLVVASHDRFFLDRIVHHVFSMDYAEEIKDFPGNYTQYEIWKAEQKSIKQSEVKTKEKPKKVEKVKTKLSYNEQREFDALEKEIPELEKRKVELSEELTRVADDHEKIMKISAELTQIVDELDTKEMRWLELSEYV
ncbi:ABC-F family ATP-binding cassette domain-containing protein [bacterium SCSIO 12643]|nr:ABC-F family ATP-binding cassette domain-containing protein [bacterium SCSIO 12643]